MSSRWRIVVLIGVALFGLIGCTDDVNGRATPESRAAGTSPGSGSGQSGEDPSLPGFTLPSFVFPSEMPAGASECVDATIPVSTAASSVAAYILSSFDGTDSPEAKKAADEALADLAAAKTALTDGLPQDASPKARDAAKDLVASLSELEDKIKANAGVSEVSRPMARIAVELSTFISECSG